MPPHFVDEFPTAAASSPQLTSGGNCPALQAVETGYYNYKRQAGGGVRGFGRWWSREQPPKRVNVVAGGRKRRAHRSHGRHGGDLDDPLNGTLMAKV